MHARINLLQGEIQTLLDIITMMFDENMHKPWDPRITWSDIMCLKVCVFGKMKHIQSDYPGE